MGVGTGDGARLTQRTGATRPSPRLRSWAGSRNRSTAEIHTILVATLAFSLVANFGSATPSSPSGSLRSAQGSTPHTGSGPTHDVAQAPPLVGSPGRYVSGPAVAKPSSWSAVVYDAADGFVLAVGPNASMGTLRNGTTPAGVETWSFSSGLWVHLSTLTAPLTRSGEALGYDSKVGQVVLFGGSFVNCSSCPPSYLNDTWTFRDGIWTNQTSVAGSPPPARVNGQLVDDPAEGGAVLFDGVGPGGTRGGNYTDTWLFANDHWAEYPVGPAPPNQGGMVFDSADGSVVYFGGGLPTGGYTNQTWRFMHGYWLDDTGNLTRLPSPRSDAAVGYDAGTGQLVLFGGYEGTVPASGAWILLNDTWSFSSNTWTRLQPTSSPASRAGAALVSDLSWGGMDLVGGWGPAPGTPGAVWVYANDTWHQGGPSLLPSRSVSDTGLPVTLSVRSVLPLSPPTLTYQGLPPGCPSSNSTTLLCVPTGYGHFVVEVTVIAPGVTVASAATELTINPVPTIGSFTVSVSEPLIGTSLALAVSTVGGTGPFTFTYDGLPDGCHSSNSSSIVCTPSSVGDYSVGVTATDALGLAASGAVNFTVVPAAGGAGPALNIASFAEGMGLIIGGATVVGVVVWMRAERTRASREFAGALRREGPRLDAEADSAHHENATRNK